MRVTDIGYLPKMPYFIGYQGEITIKIPWEYRGNTEKVI